MIWSLAGFLSCPLSGYTVLLGALDPLQDDDDDAKENGSQPHEKRYVKFCMIEITALMHRFSPLFMWFCHIHILVNDVAGCDKHKGLINMTWICNGISWIKKN